MAARALKVDPIQKLQFEFFAPKKNFSDYPSPYQGTLTEGESLVQLTSVY